MERVTQLLSENKQKLVNLAEALLLHEVLEADEILKAMEGELLTDTRKSRSYLKDRSNRAERREAAEAEGGTAVAEPKPEDAKPEGDADNKGGRFDASA
jgi:hypothetical protein